MMYGETIDRSERGIESTCQLDAALTSFPALSNFSVFSNTCFVCIDEVKLNLDTKIRTSQVVHSSTRSSLNFRSKQYPLIN